jgi:hypothetical protein
MRRPQKGETGTAKELGQHPDFYKISLFAPLPGESCGQQVLPLPPQMMNRSQQQTKKPAIDSKDSPGMVSCDDHDGKNGAMDSNNEAKGESADLTVESLQQNQDEKTNSDAFVSSADEVEVAVSQFMVAGNPLDSPPRLPDSERSMSDVHSARTPYSYTAGHEFGYMPASSGASVSSWNDQHEHDLMLGGMSATSSIGSPTCAQGSPNESFRSLANNCFGQVTPPGRMRPITNRGSHHQRPQELMRLPYAHASQLEEEADTSGLSVADLCYLTQQNRILLSQAHRRADFPK